MEVIALKGKSNCGKSHTLNIVYQLLLNDGYTQVKGYFRVLGNHVQEDFFDILEKDGKRIGFATMGDYFEKNKIREDDSVAALLKKLGDENCEKAICASSTEDTLKEVEFYPHHILINKRESNIESEQRIKNGEDAQRILKLIY